MAHSKCFACQARVWREGDPAEHLADLCPGCGGPLEAIVDLNALVGLRCLRARPRRTRRRSPDRFERICAQIHEATARNDTKRP
jgi:hypothetical protein